MTEAEREFMKWLVADHVRVLRQIEHEAANIEDYDSVRIYTSVARIKNLCRASTKDMNDRLARIPESDREKWQ